ncbi:MAG: hypothetical protein HOK81_08705 [Rhodospirillaceae bacterium]|jgi:hypothetical protein|nr:hypothetical protein [Rhodospirillaceae bacterium]
MKKWRPFVGLDLPDDEVMDTGRKPWGVRRDIGPNPGLLALLSILFLSPFLFFLRNARRDEAANNLHNARRDETADGPYRPTRLDQTFFGRVFSGGEWGDQSQPEKPAGERKQEKLEEP